MEHKASTVYCTYVITLVNISASLMTLMMRWENDDGEMEIQQAIEASLQECTIHIALDCI